MTTLTGSSISQLPAVGGPGAIRRDDSFFVSRRLVPWMVHEEYVSERLPFGDFADRLFADLSAGFGFGGMIHEVSSDYSPASHSHPYNKFAARSPEPYDEQKHVVLATFSVDGRKVRAISPRPFVYKQPDPVIGELKFVALPSTPSPASININSPDFDGWVYPNGQTYYVQAWQFREAKALFGQDPGMNQISLPLLNSFVSLSAGPTTGVQHAEGNVVVPNHAHSGSTVYFDSSKTMNMSVRIGTHKSAGDYGMIHLGSKPSSKDTQWPKPYEATLVLGAKSVTVSDSAKVQNSDAAAARESYPSHDMLPVMIYIGRNEGGGGEGGGSGDGRLYTRVYRADGTVWNINVADLTRDALDFAGGQQ